METIGIADYPSEKQVNVLDKAKQLQRGSVITGCRKKRRNNGANRVYATNGAMHGGNGQRNEKKHIFYEFLFCLQHHNDWFRVWIHHGERLLNFCVVRRHTGTATASWFGGGIRFPCRTPLVCIASTLISLRYNSEVLDFVVIPYIECLTSAIFQQDNP
ncbi:transposable element Tcb1 transposase [Trichonephila clavipes]|nr:transposable element Tcb1 transposase [Trichonephila clavipes]